MAQSLTTEFIHKMIGGSKRIFFAAGGMSTVTTVYNPENVTINEYAHFFQIRFPENRTLLTINKDVSLFGYANTLQPDDTRYAIKEDSTIGYIFSESGAEILFDNELF